MSAGPADPFDNPFAAPRSDLTPEAAGAGAGGLAAAVAGDTGWSIGAVLEEAWRLTRGFKGTFWLAALALVGVNLLVNFLLEVIARSTQQPLLVAAGSLAATVFLIWPLQAGVLTLGIGLIWLGPLAVLVLGVVYRRMFGVADDAAAPR